jgi:hypothetical protein
VTSSPTISGVAQQGQTLSASTGSWGGTTPINYAYQWQRCDSVGASCSPVAGATSSGFLLAAADVGQTIRVSVTATNSAGSATASSPATAVVGAASGCTEPASATADRLYSCASTFNTPIPANAPIHPDTSLMISRDTWVKNYDSNSIYRPWFGLWKEYESLVFASASTPLVTVQINNRSTGQCGWTQIRAPIPTTAQVRLSGVENSLSVLAADGQEYEFYDLTPPGTSNTVLSGNTLSCPANSQWQASSFSVPGWGSGTSGWTGAGYGKDSIRASDISTASGMVRLRDVQNNPADWGHALAFTYHKTCGSSAPHPRFVPPARSSDGSYNSSGCLPMGARVQLDPTVDCATHPWVIKHGAWAEAYCRTLQKYGAIAVDSNGASVFNQVYNTDWNAYPWASQYNTGCMVAGCDQSASIALPNDLMGRFRVIDWTRWTGA